MASPRSRPSRDSNTNPIPPDPASTTATAASASTPSSPRLPSPSVGAQTADRSFDLDPGALGERLRHLRLERGLTLGQVAAGRFSSAFLSQIERGLVRPSAPNLAHIARQLGVDLHDLVRTVPRTADRELTELRLTEGRAALARDDPKAALEALEAIPRSLAPSDAVEVELLRADALVRLGRYEEGLDALEHVRTTAPTSLLTADLRLRMAEIVGRAAYRRQRYHHALQVLREAEDELDDPTVDPMTRSRFLRARGACLFMVGQEAAAIGDYQAALDASSQVADLAELGRIYDALNSAHQALGNYTEALAYARRSAQIFEVLDDARHLGQTHHNMGELFLRQGDLEKAEEAFGRAISIFRAASAPDLEAYALHSLATVALRRGDLESAARLAGSAASVAEHTEDLTLRGDVALLRGDIAARGGSLDEAEAYLAVAIAAFEDAQARRRLADACYAMASVLARKGDEKRALSFAMRAYVPPGTI